MSMLAYANPWRFQADPEVYLLVAFLIGAYVYMVREIGPSAVKPGEVVVTHRQIGCFVGAMVLLFAASTWPIHQIGEEYLYSVHMVQHMVLSYFMPPLVLMAMPEWLLRTLIGDGKAYRFLRRATKPVVAGLLFNAVIIVTHIPAVVNHSVQSAPEHYSLHFVVVLVSLLMWMPVVGPFPELQMAPAGKMIYLFAQSVVPVIPAAWLTFADGAVYKVYDEPVRVWGLTVTDDQQLAGAIMKIGGSAYLWGIVIFLWVKRFGTNWKEEATFRRTGDGANGIASSMHAASAPSSGPKSDWVPRDRVSVTSASEPIDSR
ncbi:MAG: cytochrome c oxidase assembly protein [Ilumatobacteraceae bacterium]